MLEFDCRIVSPDRTCWCVFRTPDYTGRSKSHGARVGRTICLVTTAQAAAQSREFISIKYAPKCLHE
eukprot:8865202-Pyramimonas_sp.AAC.1